MHAPICNRFSNRTWEGRNIKGENRFGNQVSLTYDLIFTSPLLNVLVLHSSNGRMLLTLIEIWNNIRDKSPFQI